MKTLVLLLTFLVLVSSRPVRAETSQAVETPVVRDVALDLQPAGPVDAESSQAPLLPASARARSTAALAAFDAEPTVAQVQAWAIEHARLSPFEASRLVRQARLRGALPTVRLHARYRSSSSTEWDELDLVDSRDLDNDISINIWLEWDLAELASGTDMARALRESRARLELRHAVVNQVTTDYFDRRLLCAEDGLAGDEDAAVIIGRRLRVEELDATLDGLTGGRWSRALRSEPSERSGQDPNTGLRVPVHTTDRSPDP